MLVAGVGAHLGEHDRRLLPVGQVVQRGDHVPAVHLALVDLLGAVIQPGRVAEADRVGGGEQAEARVRLDDPVLVEQGEPPLHLQHALDHEHHVRPARVVLVEHERARVLQRPGQDALAELRHLLAILQDNGVLADEVDAADVAIEIDPDAGPVEPRRHLLDVGALAGAVIALDHAAPVEGEAGEDRQRRLAVEAVGAVDLGHVLGPRGEGGHLHVDVDAEHGACDLAAARTDEASQAAALRRQTTELRGQLSARNPAFPVLGGTPFEWNDEWWKRGSPAAQDPGGFPHDGVAADRFANEEWWGVVDVDRRPRAAYQVLKELYAP